MMRIQFIQKYKSKYSRVFLSALWFVMDAEGGFHADGGYVNDPVDRGGETKYGISKRAFPKEDIANLTMDRAVMLYHVRYWRAAHCADLKPHMAVVTFDSAVQHGYVNAIRMLQEKIGAKPDGIYGPKTEALVQTAIDLETTARLITRRGRFYARILKKNPKQSRFIEGWFNRLDHLVIFLWRNNFN